MYAGVFSVSFKMSVGRSRSERKAQQSSGCRRHAGLMSQSPLNMSSWSCSRCVDRHRASCLRGSGADRGRGMRGSPADSLPLCLCVAGFCMVHCALCTRTELRKCIWWQIASANTMARKRRLQHAVGVGFRYSPRQSRLQPASSTCPAPVEE